MSSDNKENVEMKAVNLEEDKQGMESTEANDVESGDIASENSDEMANLKHYVREKRTKPFIVLVSCVAAFGGLIFGYDIAGAGATFLMDGFRLHFGWDCPEDDPTCIPASEQRINADQGGINGAFGASATIGALTAPYFADTFGRKWTLFLAALVFTFGAALQAGAVNMTMMIVARLFSGFGIGALSMVSPVYTAEVAPEHCRGQLSTLWQVAITFGILIASAANLGLKKWSEGWRISYGGNILFSVILMFALFFMPESPRWLTAKGRDDEARAALMRTRYEDEVEGDIELLEKECADEKAMGVSSWREVFATDNKLRYRLLLGIGLQTVQQLSGINAIMFYAPTILNRFFGTDKAIVGTFILNAINFLSTFITIYLVERAGRVKLLVSGGIIMMFTLIANGILSAIKQTQSVGYLVLIFAAMYIVGFAYSWGPVVWTVCSEMFPLRARGKATGLTSMSNWLWTTVVGAIFPMASSASLAGCFFFFAAIILLGSIMVYFFQVETAKKTLTEIDHDYAHHKPQLIRKKWN